MTFHSQIFFIFFLLLTRSFADQITLKLYPPYNSLRSCGANCFDGGWKVGSLLKCQPFDTPDNSCFCRPDLQVTAVGYVLSCASTACSGNQLDVSSATQVYKDYCIGVGYSAAPASVPAQTTGMYSTTNFPIVLTNSI
jgi:hypothetical protein